MEKKKGKFQKDDVWCLIIGEKIWMMLAAVAALWLCYKAELVELVFLVGVLVLMESVACYRIGRWVGRKKTKEA